MLCPFKIENFEVPDAAGPQGQDLLASRETAVELFYRNKNHYRELLRQFTEEIDDLQRLLYASAKYSLLLVFQGMDTSGKDGAIRHVMSGINPQGCQVRSFKQPSTEELAHDYLWRVWKHLPPRGKIGIFNRSHYEEVLIVKAQPELLQKQNLPEEVMKDPDFWEHRYRDIRQFETYLSRNGTVILKFFLHISKEEQRSRLLARTKNSNKHWKLSQADLESRSRWDLFQSVYNDCIRATSHKTAPWYIIPADDKQNARLMISYIILEKLKSLNLAYPTLSMKEKREVARIRKTLRQETGS